MSKSKWYWSSRMLLGGVVFVAIALSLACANTATSSDLEDDSFVASATEPGSAVALSAAASRLGDGPPRERGQGPPEEALTACADTNVGESCTFTGRDGESRDGTCIALPDESEQVVCRPDDTAGRARGDRQGPNEEALAACSDATSGDVCAFEAPFGSVSGTCEMPPKGDSLACRPTNRRR